MHLLLRSFSRLGLSLHPFFLFLTAQPLLPIFKAPPLSFFLPDVALDAEHQQYFLSEFVVELDILFGGHNFVWDAHSLKHFKEPFIDFAGQGQSFAQVLLS